ncbi:hypothetical protein [Acinetobacter sp. WZC-1]|uniref:hypothetical protein n=1 Tax=Acinetobacter sp. WZC-1 TaxID=3459034 RepID=UPI00403DDA4C
MTGLGYTTKFQKTLLASLTGLCISHSCFALEALSDESLSESTGEGLALLPENYSMRFNGSNDAAGGGSIRFIPVGPLSQAAESKGYAKADVFVNGISLGQSKKDVGVARDATDWGVGYGNIGTAANDFARTITSWGSASNPWILKTVTNNNVPDFSGVVKSVSYLTLEAPLMHNVIPTTGPEASAYNLKMGLYSDAFMRDKTVAESTTGNLTAGLSNRLRLSLVWDGFGINGSSLKLFRTLDGVTDNNIGGQYTANLKINNVITPKTFNYGLNKSYNQTLGLAGVFRMNSGDTTGANSRATITTGAVTGNIYQLDFSRNADNSVKRDEAGNVIYTQGANVTAAPNTASGVLQTYRPPTNSPKTNTYDGLPPGGSYPSGGMCTDPKANNRDAAGCMVQEGVTARRFVASASNSWNMPGARSVIRLSTQELTGSINTDGTPALGGAIPNFRPNANAEGVFLYNPNINLVLGNLSQPLIFNTDGSNFSMELTRIPNNVNVYSRIYQRYADIPEDQLVDQNITYLGNTCTVNKCGGTVNIGGVTYQDSKATHGSISFGSTVLDQYGYLKAYNGIGAFGVSIGELKSGTNLTSQLVQDYTQVWQQSRSTYACGFLWTSTCWGDWGAWSAVTPKTATATNPNPYETTNRQNMNGQILGVQTTMPANPQTMLNSMQPVGQTVGNNLGSVAIDGLLIQHFKFTTTGL